MSMQAPVLNLSLHARQGDAFMTEANEILYGGAAGGGKSHLFRVASIVWATQIPGLQCYLFRRLFNELVQNHLEGPTGYPALLAPLIQSGHCAIVKSEIRFWNGSKIFLRHCQYEKNVFSYQGTEIHLLMIDELTHWSEKMYRYLRGRCRLGGLKLPEQFKGAFPRILCGTNPGGMGHHWVRASFVDHGPKPHKTAREEGGMTRQFIPALLEDNPSLLENDPDYELRLEGLGDALLVKAMRLGDWDVVAGAMFGYIWRKDLHIAEPFDIPLSWEIWRGADDGFAAPACSLWFTQNPDTKTIYVIDEIYKPGMLPDYFGERTIEIDRAIVRQAIGGKKLNNPDAVDGLMDAAAFQDIGQSSGGQRVPTRGEQMNLKGCKWKPVDKPPGSRVQGCQNIHRLLAPNEKDPKGRPGLQIFPKCKNLIRTLPTIQRDEDNQEDVDTDDEDHAYDALRYGLQKKMGLGKAPKVGGK